MKTFKIYAITVISALFTFSAFGQINVIANGKVKIGNEWPNNDYNNEVTQEVFGLSSASYRPGGKLSFGDYGSIVNYSSNVTIGEYGNYDSDALQLNGKYGIYMTSGGQGNYNVALFTSSGDLELRGTVHSYSSIITSDERLKKNIKPCTNALQSILKLRGITYDFKTDSAEMYLASLKKVKTLDDKSARDLLRSQKETEDKIKASANQVGFSAQELQKVLPQLVVTGNDGLLAVNYIGVIPVLVESIKEQQAIIDAQKATIDAQAAAIDALQKDIAAIKKKIGL